MEISDVDAGFELLKSGYVVAAYDSQYMEGQYGPHDREGAYREVNAENFGACTASPQCLQDQIQIPRSFAFAC